MIKEVIQRQVKNAYCIMSTINKVEMLKDGLATILDKNKINAEEHNVPVNLSLFSILFSESFNVIFRSPESIKLIFKEYHSNFYKDFFIDYPLVTPDELDGWLEALHVYIVSVDRELSK